MTHEEFQFNAKIMGFDIIIQDNIYNAQVLQDYMSSTEILEYPDQMTIAGSISFKYYHIMPKTYIFVDGSLTLPDIDCQVPKVIMANSNVYMTGSKIKTMPERLTIFNGSLFARDTKFEYLPEYLRVESSIYLGNSRIKELPDDLIVHKELVLNDCKNIQVLPKNLTVLGSLYLMYSSIKEIPVCTKANYIHKEF